MMTMRGIALLGVLALCACRDAASSEIKVRPAQVVPGTTPYTGDKNISPDDRDHSDPSLAPKDPTAKTTDGAKGDKTDEEWIPAEHKSGAARWKDTGVYLDGQPIGFLSWAELPVTLKPTWVKDKVSANKRPGTNDLGWRWAQQRFYRFTDYLKALGIDPRKVKEMHVYGPRLGQTTIATGADLMSPQAKDFMFRFGSSVGGKAIPQVPEGFGRGRPADKIASVMIYIDKKPPTLHKDGLELDGVPQWGVPYYGEPLRGGIRVYLDNRLATVIKREQLDPKQATKNARGELEWSFGALMTAKGVDLSKVVELWVIRDGRRHEKLPAAGLAEMTFEAPEKAKTRGGGIFLGADRIRANAISLSTRPIRDDELPVITQDDE